MKIKYLFLTVLAVGFSLPIFSMSFVFFSPQSVHAQSGQWKTLHTNFIVAYDMVFTSDDTGYLAGQHAIVRTTDGGLNFQVMNLPVDTGHTNFESMSWPTHSIGYACGILDSTNTGLQGLTVILKTTDAGNTWVRLPIDSMFSLFKIDFPTPDIGYYIGYSDKAGSSVPARLAKTTNGGLTWNTVIFDNTFLVSKISFRNEREGFFGHQRTFGSVTASDLVYTSDGLGSTSVRDDSLAPINDIISLLPIADGSWLITADGNLWRTTNAGMAWHTVNIPNEFSAAILAASGNLVFEVNNSLSIDFANASTDYGKTWTATTKLSDTGFVELMNMPSKHTAYLYMQSNNPNLRHELLKWTNTDNLAVENRSTFANDLTVSYDGHSVVFEYSDKLAGNPIQLFDMLGRSVAQGLSTSGAGKSRLDMRALSSGVYFATLHGARAKFVVAH